MQRAEEPEPDPYEIHCRLEVVERWIATVWNDRAALEARVRELASAQRERVMHIINGGGALVAGFHAVHGMLAAGMAEEWVDRFLALTAPISPWW